MADDVTLEMGAVTLSVSDLDRSCEYYGGAVGLHLIDRSGDTATFGAGERVLLELIEKRGAALDSRAPGLFHFALLVPTRRDLGNALKHLIETRAPLQGVADHIVSEAIYLVDPDGHGIEIYRDRARSQWKYDEGGRLEMATLPLDAEGILEESDPDACPALPDGTRMGHVHLQVGDLEEAQPFFTETLGLDVTATMPHALFFGVDGYHHHLGANTWRSRGRAPRDEGLLGLEQFDVHGTRFDEPGVRSGPDGIRTRLVPLESPTTRALTPP